MCGRYNKILTEFVENYHEHLRDFMDVMAPGKSQYNVAPTTTQPIRCSDGQKTFVQDAKWGLMPFWSRNLRGYQINARSETVAQKAMFKHAFQTRRCVTWATGYYEWHTSGKMKWPYYIHFKDHRPFFFYGIWGIWTDPESKIQTTTFATITTEPVKDLAFIHDRMPCIVDVDSPDVDLWLNHNDEDFDARHKLLHPYEAERLVAVPVSQYVNNVKNQGPKCVEEFTLPPKLQGLFEIWRNLPR
jgi:putative SOS response-associated peptidase YedK